MAEPQASSDATNATASPVQPTPAQPQSRAHHPNQIHTRPLPFRTFPLPSFYPNNPISLLQLAYAWLKQVLSPPPAEPSVVYKGVWSPETGSVHVRDPATIRALWEQGFFGKGSLSRSEPNWLKREQQRRGADGIVIEQVTQARRQDRIRAKWERARLEQEAIEQTRLEETRHAAQKVPHTLSTASLKKRCTDAPVGPLQLLALPNSYLDLAVNSNKAQVATPSNLSALVNGHASSPPLSDGEEDKPVSDMTNGLAKHPTDSENGLFNGLHLDSFPVLTPPGTPPTNGHRLVGAAPAPNGISSAKPLKRRKSVRFSHKVESTTFQLEDPPSPAPTTKTSNGPTDGAPANPMRAMRTWYSSASNSQDKETKQAEAEAESEPLADREYLQLSPQEAFFLVFAIGALAIVDPQTEQPIPTLDLLTLLRQYSYFPPRIPAFSSQQLVPDDPFLVHYVVYHHFRSLGWVMRDGIKFGVNWLLYNRGPAFDHAEFGALVIPSFTDPWWKAQGKQAPRKKWPWLVGVNRALARVYKSLVLVYVDVPPPPAFDERLGEGDVAGVFRQYKVREIMVSRWSANRNRD